MSKEEIINALEKQISILNEKIYELEDDLAISIRVKNEYKDMYEDIKRKTERLKNALDDL